ncbi:hypothetical protein NIES25_08510 [Nostoc linckia NIES-25]|nr:hypothetical protein NIES25_08510 [Nostoc linckia NIES-25]
MRTIISIFLSEMAMTQTQHPTKSLTFKEFLAYGDRTDTRYELFFIILRK